jgi:tRNA threonylcarbamoyl adenosine modification protein YjeE
MDLQPDQENQRFSRRFALPDPAATDRLGARIAAGLRIGDAVALQGDLGAGKTTLARAILRHLGVADAVPSPSFTLVQFYETPRFPVRHYDLYRLRAESEMEELGLDEALDEGAALIEWPERAAAFLPEDSLAVHLEMENAARSAMLRGPQRWRELEIADVA